MFVAGHIREYHRSDPLNSHLLSGDCSIRPSCCRAGVAITRMSTVVSMITLKGICSMLQRQTYGAIIALESEIGGSYPKSGSGVTLARFLDSSSASLEPAVVSTCTSPFDSGIRAGRRLFVMERRHLRTELKTVWPGERDTQLTGGSVPAACVRCFSGPATSARFRAVLTRIVPRHGVEVVEIA